ncbi:ATP-binding cassette sub-family A member 6, partial [Galemys pyrenaicus]
VVRLAEDLKFQKELKNPVKTLSDGIKRKVRVGGRITQIGYTDRFQTLFLSFQLGFARSILGNMLVVLLDKMSMGMDPEGIRFQEWGAPILLGLYIGLFSYYNQYTIFSEKPPQNLGRVDKFNESFVLVYTPISNITQQIMNITTFAPFLKGRKIIGMSNKKDIDKILQDNFPHVLEITFYDNFSYNLRFVVGYKIPFLREDLFTAHCWDTNKDYSCVLAQYWNDGFVPLQTAINAAITQVMTNHSVMEKLMSVIAINMKTLSFISKEFLTNERLIIYCLLYFSSFIYFALLNVTKERKKSKDVMNMMGLQDSAFWFSWGLIYSGFIFIISILALSFLMSVLLKKTVLTSLVVFFLTLFWGCMGFTAYYGQLPSSLEWILSICSPFAFTNGMTKIIHLDYKNTVNGNERRYSPLFFLKSSCFRRQRIGNKVIKEIDLEHPPNDYFEPVSPEFRGKEAIRIRNVKKEYKGRSGKIEVLKGMFFDIYEGQITAVLGHSGAGKSSLLNILNGLSVPTEGSVTIYNKSLSEMQDLDEIRKITGVCPQFNIHFDMLTVKENLRLFAKIKGIQPQEVEQEVQRILLELDIQNIQDNLANLLSEGQKRKLTFGIAILGDPQVLILDEPTAGLDPFSRHQIWSFLKERKANRVILLSTNFMDEADLLADRKVIMSSGILKCAGSSMFLKRRWGLGYHLSKVVLKGETFNKGSSLVVVMENINELSFLLNISLYRNKICDPEKVTSFLNHHIPDAKLKTENKEMLVYTLPLEKTNKFPDLFCDLDKCSVQGVMSYDVSMSTLNEVFMKLEGTSTMRQDFEQAEMIKETENLHGMQSVHSALPDMQKVVSGMCLWRMQVCAIAWLRFLKFKRGTKELLTLLLVFGISMLPFIVESILEALVIGQKSDWEFKPELYFLSPGQLPEYPRSSLLIINNTESNIEDFIQSLKHQNLLLEVDDFENRNGTDDLSYNGAIIVAGKPKDYRFSIVCNTKRLHCFPILMNIISNGLLGMFNHTQSIRTLRNSFPLGFAIIWSGLPYGSVFLFSIVGAISPYIAMSSVDDYKKRVISPLWTSGLYPSAYWCGQALVDVHLYTFILLLMYLFIYMLSIFHIHLTSQIVFILVVVVYGYTASLVFMTYVISFIFHNRRKNSGFWSFFFYFMITVTFEISQSNNYDLVVLFVGMVLVPPTTLAGFITIFEANVYTYQNEFHDLNYNLSKVDLLLCLIPYFQALLFAFVLRCMEMKCGKKVMRKDPIFRICPQKGNVRRNPEEPVDEDEDVQAERMRAATALTTSSAEETPAILASCLRKEYADQKKSCFSKRKKKIAIRNISFCVKKGEILGLLGPNGAGKSSSIRMISGVSKPTAGEVELNGCSSVWDLQGSGDVQSLALCPQENTLWPNLTTKEHLQVFAAVKGLRKGEATLAISRLADTFRLHDHLNVPVRRLTPGAARKLCFVLSILGNSPILLLDEMSAGVDPRGQQHMQTIQETIKNTEKAALLTTHYLAEAEALCDRIAIMVSGRLRCVGSIQHLKNKFGKDYILELKLKDTAQVTLVQTEILKLFPQAAQQERYSSFLAYKLPLTDVQPLSQTFCKLEAVKHNFNLEEYSLSQCTLEKVILELSKEQQLGSFDEEVDTTMRWKLLLHSDDP